ncbi:hypothetical protein KC622_03000 [Candidatus Dojkabacteria bacterium]|uniref:Uncharacterized protein n=1 Tax=Candidatus Dojkabacteria bacterium TaxID=2099670 RepID=A0A955KV41_9BACT|nr:hypothetical protein [Candidatus Dojkabacteria bacterium]
MPTFLELARLPETDRGFIGLMEEARLSGGGIVVCLDPHDDLRLGEDSDLGYHYALLGLDPGMDLDTNSRIGMAGLIPPLPMLTERLGYVGFRSRTTREEIIQGSFETRIQINFQQMMRLLYDIFDGKVKYGLRLN